MESELETEALRKYLAEVEAAAAGLQSRVQELEHLITICGLLDFSYYAPSQVQMPLNCSQEDINQCAWLALNSHKLLIIYFHHIYASLVVHYRKYEVIHVCCLT